MKLTNNAVAPPVDGLANEPLTLKSLLVDLALETKRFIENKFAPRDARIVALEERVGTLEAERQQRKADPPMHFRAGYDGDRQYVAGDVVQRRGQLWIATSLSKATPPPAPCWRLLDRSGERAPRLE